MYCNVIYERMNVLYVLYVCIFLCTYLCSFKTYMKHRCFFERSYVFENAGSSFCSRQQDTKPWEVPAGAGLSDDPTGCGISQKFSRDFFWKTHVKLIFFFENLKFSFIQFSRHSVHHMQVLFCFFTVLQPLVEVLSFWKLQSSLVAVLLFCLGTGRFTQAKTSPVRRGADTKLPFDQISQLFKHLGTSSNVGGTGGLTMSSWAAC